jgi:hypothetical protein
MATPIAVRFANVPCSTPRWANRNLTQRSMTASLESADFLNRHWEQYKDPNIKILGVPTRRSGATWTCRPATTKAAPRAEIKALPTGARTISTFLSISVFWKSIDHFSIRK